MSNTDKMVRIMLVLLIAVLYFTNIIEGTLALVLLVAATIILLTTFVNWCPIYAIFGLNTCKMDETPTE